MWNFFKKLFGGGSKQTQTVGPDSIAIQAGNSIQVFNIRTTQSIKPEVTEDLSKETREALQRSLEKLGSRVSSGPVDRDIARSTLNNSELQRQWVDIQRGATNPHGVTAKDLDIARGGVTAGKDRFRKTQSDMDAMRVGVMANVKASSTLGKSAIDHVALERDRQRRLREEEERRRRQRSEDDERLQQSQLWNNTNTTNNYEAPEPVKHECAPVTNSHYSHDSGHNHSCPAHDYSNHSYDSGSSSFSSMD
jgi:hypothetical protein